MKVQTNNKSGRLQAIVHLTEEWEGPRVVFNAWPVGDVVASATLRLDSDDRAIHARLVTPLAGCSLTLVEAWSHSFARRAYAWAERMAASPRSPLGFAYELDPLDRQVFDVGFLDGTITVSAWTNGQWADFDRSHAPWLTNGWTAHLDVVHALLGDVVFDRDAEEVSGVVVQLPEGTYNATLTSWRQRHYRKRALVKPEWSWRFSVEVEEGVPIPGRGENAYDIDEDAIYAITFPESVNPTHEVLAARAFADSVLQARLRYANRVDWAPRDGWPAHCRQPQPDTPA